MKHLFSLVALLISLPLLADDSIGKVEPDHTSSFENYKLLIVAVAGLLLLMGLRIWFKRKKKS